MDTNLYVALGTRKDEVCCVPFMEEENVPSSIHAIVKFEQNVPVCEVSSFSLVVMELQTFLSGDIELISNIIGHQGCSATYPCYYCYIKLALLQEGKTSSEVRTKTKNKGHAEVVLLQNQIKSKKGRPRPTTFGPIL